MNKLDLRAAPNSITNRRYAYAKCAILWTTQTAQRHTWTPVDNQDSGKNVGKSKKVGKALTQPD